MMSDGMIVGKVELGNKNREKKLVDELKKLYKTEKEIEKMMEVKNENCGCDCDCETSKKVSGEVGEKKSVNSQNMGQCANAGLAMDDELTATRLLQKHYSPLVVRRHYVGQGPLFVGLICDADLSDLDKLILDIVDEGEKMGLFINNIQSARNFAGYMNDRIEKYYNGKKRGVVEGVAVLWYVDNMMISSMNKNFMCHEKCTAEFYSICNIMTKI